MRHELITSAQASPQAWVWLRDAATLVSVWLRAILRLGSVIAFSVGVLALLLVKSVVRVFGHAN